MSVSKSSDAGSAVLDFLAFGMPGIFILLIAAQLVYAAYLNTVTFDAALEGAGVASLADGTDAAAVLRSRQAIQALSGVVIQGITVGHDAVGGHQVSSVTVSVESPVLGFGVIPVTQTAEAIDEPR